ncbi:GDSL-like lipase/acylhydrolase domain protein [Rhizoctonia solani AG-1 IB]|uniref:GDSL-like lipase/acylhydrolase domain protein n=1 Tax=Thanatephorus cucumeris (strain AG1-IB / isolate 7/3/14) TaxID=1108050 RepID=A0A0B7FFX4_THACB|nr:GDSL-like lipase/acylhydrolase domain protein [Rhizoctonia solani AG-1 IB]
MLKTSVAAALLATVVSAASPVVVLPDTKLLHKHGRWDATNGTWWPGSGFKLAASNLTSFNLNLGWTGTNWPSVAVSLSVDYEPFKQVNISGGVNSIPIPAAAASKTRVVRVNVQASTGTRMQLDRIELNEGAKLKEYKPSPLRFQFIGDSLSAGYLNPNGVNDCWTFLSSQEFKAEHNIMAQSGACLTDKECFSNIHGLSYQYFVTEDTSYRWDVNHNYTTPWDFKRDLAPTHIIIYIGANDSSNNVAPADFTQELIKFTIRLRTLYPKQPFLVFTPWGWSDGTSPFWPFYPGVYEDVVKNRTLSGDKNVFLVNTTGWLQQNGVIPGDGHPNPTGQKQIQAKFSEWLKAFGVKPRSKWETQ